MRPFLVCIHDASPAFAADVRTMLDGLEPLVGRHLSLGVVPNWHGAWPLAAYPGFCTLLRERADELLLHGDQHRRAAGRGAVSLLTGDADEMNGVTRARTTALLHRGVRIIEYAVGETPRGFLPPAWQAGHARERFGDTRLEYVMGHCTLRSRTGARALATASWDCGRLGALGHVGGAMGAALRALPGRVPVLALHPRDLARGFWPRILVTARALLANGHEPTTPSALLAAPAGHTSGRTREHASEYFRARGAHVTP